jgi:hypothetical protein
MPVDKDRPTATKANSQNSGVEPQILWLIWGSLLAFIGFYGVLTQVIEVSNEMESGTLTTMTFTLGIFAAGEIPVIWVLRRMTFWSRLEDGVFEDSEAVGQAYFTACILSWALCESIAIYGFVLAFLSGDVIYYIPFAAIGASLMVVFRPDLAGVLEKHREQSAEPSTNEPSLETDEW